MNSDNNNNNNNNNNNKNNKITLNPREIKDLSLISNFSDQKKIKFTIKTKDSEKITTLFSHQAKPLVDRYKFIKGFNDGSLDFYSIKKAFNKIKQRSKKVSNPFLKKNTPNKIAKKILNFKYDLKKIFYDI